MLPNDQEDKKSDSAIPLRKDKVIQPLSTAVDTDTENLAANLIRQKLQSLYDEEPSTKEELSEVKSMGKPHSKHQRYMLELSNSGKSLAEIQTAWHNYYVGLPDREKHEVWQEFYANHGQKFHAKPATAEQLPPQVHTPHEHKIHAPLTSATNTEIRTVRDLKKQLIGKINTKASASRNAHRQSMLFGLGMGMLFLAVTMFSFFNERFIAPFISPSRNITSTPIILDTNTAVGKESKIVIPKINVDVPVVYDEPSIEEKAVQRALERGVLHYGITPNPGEQGNAVIFGHSSNNILNRGKYKFAFVLLSKMEDGDTFYIQKDGKRYIYRVTDKRIIKPDDVSVLNSIKGKSTATLITCDPPGTAINRLIVVGEQIAPDPARNVASSVNDQENQVEPAVLPSNAPSLWSRFYNWLTN